MTCLALTKDGRLLASASADKTIRLWDLPRQESVATIPAHQAEAVSVALSPDGRILASGGWDKTVKLWDVEARKGLTTLNGHRRAVFAVAFSPDGKTLASTDAGDEVKLWDVASGREVRSLRSQIGWWGGLAFTPDGKTLASIRLQEAVLWDVATGQRIRTLDNNGSEIFCLSFSKDGKTLLAGDADGIVNFWDAGTGKRRGELRSHTEIAYVQAIAISPDGRLLAVANGTIILWIVIRPGSSSCMTWRKWLPTVRDDNQSTQSSREAKQRPVST